MVVGASIFILLGRVEGSASTTITMPLNVFSRPLIYTGYRCCSSSLLKSSYYSSSCFAQYLKPLLSLCSIMNAVRAETINEAMSGSGMSTVMYGMYGGAPPSPKLFDELMRGWSVFTLTGERPVRAPMNPKNYARLRSSEPELEVGRAN
jgi:hypothetical protein